MAYYDISLGGIALPTFEQDFSETLGSDYQLVGSAVMPGPPRPASMYNMTINIYGGQDEPDRTTTGFTKRGQVKSMLQNAATRFAGVAFTVSFDSSLNGYLVIGTADLVYNVGGATFGDFQLRVSNAVWIPAPLTIQAMVTRPTALTADPSEVRYYLPVGAKEVTGQFDPVLPELHPYATAEGEGYYVMGRPTGEVIRYRQEWDDVLKGDVKVFDGDVQAYGPLWDFPSGVGPVVDNGRCRVSWDGGGAVTVETVNKGRYEPHGAVQTGYTDIGKPFIVSWTPQEAVVRVPVSSGNTERADVMVRLARGWQGPQITIQHQGEPTKTGVEGIKADVVSADKHERFSLGAEATSRGTTEHRIFRAAV